MQFGLTEEQEMIVSTVRSFVENEIYPHEAEVDRTGEVPQEVANEIKRKTIELGFYACNFPEEVGAAGLSHSLFGKRLIPIGTVYDPFVHRGLDALNYACYQDARFIIAGTPSGVTLAPEGGAHQSIGAQLIGMSQDGLVSFEPA